LARLSETLTTECQTENWEATNLLTVAAVLTAAARRRTETRGSHWREDYPATDPKWCGRLMTTLRPEGALDTAFVLL
jgi:L-aspartate oxidase